MIFENIGNMLLFLIFVCFYTNTIFSLANDTISANQTLSGNQTIVSSGGNFELGFFTPSKSSKYYIGIWYKKIPEKTVIWVANRETPISDSPNAQIKISGRNLVLLNESKVEIWSTALNSTGPQINTVFAALLDDGNLVLRENSVSAETLWESFDYPTHTFMPGAKLSFNKRTGRLQTLTSWKSSDDPARGLFSLEPVPYDSQFVIRWNKNEPSWSSGAWNGHTFSAVPEMRLNYIYNFSYVDNENESYFTYSLYNPSIMSRMIIDTFGQIKQSTWSGNAWSVFWLQPRNPCESCAYCGAFAIYSRSSSAHCNCLPGFKPEADDNKRCVRETNLECENGETVGSNGRRDKFLMYSNVKLPSYFESLPLIENIGECEAECLSSCVCSAYSYDENGCLVWYRELLNLVQVEQGDDDDDGKIIYIRYSAYSSVFNGSKDHTLLIVGAVLGSAAIVALISGAAIWRHRRRKHARVKNAVAGSLVGFSYKNLQLATKNFSVKLGGGGFGSVFKGTLPDSTVVAVKKLESISQGEKQFRTEVMTIGAIHHMNLVRLRGFCPEQNEKLLVYDYMENGSLDTHLFSSKDSTVLDWKIRYQIALGVARGLAYLHDKCRECIIHCDVKPENILLDADYCPKVGDFGLAKLMGRDFSRVLTTMRGTRGYLAPEWISGVPTTVKADVYSYGMMLFELVSGSRNSEYVEDKKCTYFPCLAARVIVEEGDVLSLLDPPLMKDADAEEVLRICKVACWCIQDGENVRPSMGQIVQILEGVMDVCLPPIPRSLQLMLAAKKEDDVVFFTDPSFCTNFRCWIPEEQQIRFG
ncbi:G-type lectin S-receptor-like serine/threonine-protein kinase At2g19130 [Andrographis paniculata]|uniref:G-type lectin S-receptor-like serine/threonine-protein kinase At2g19130 n=1 Tax=Andrographis paniculata TaxID=175694 RepID=UPI0021E73C24|nr:G-type lectin S-receptor-like serine/threonine-protein kinase At2g19130 [Andrographis paniculata]